MTEQKDKKAEEHYPLFEAARKVLLAGIGALALAQDEIDEFVNRLIERGEIAEKDGRQLIKEIYEKRKAHFDKAEGEFKKRFDQMVERANLATKADIEKVSKKVADLSKKIDDLMKTE